MNQTAGTKAILWGSIGAELMAVVYDLRYMVMCAIALILADLWWGYSENRMRYEHASAEDKEKYEWHKPMAGRRTANKLVDYVTFLCCGALIGMAITEPMDICSHVWTAAIGLGIGCACEVASIIGHIAYVKMHTEISIVDGWKAFVRFLGKLIKVKSNEIGEAVEDLGRDKLHHRHHHGMPDAYDEESNMED